MRTKTRQAIGVAVLALAMVGADSGVAVGEPGNVRITQIDSVPAGRFRVGECNSFRVIMRSQDRFSRGRLLRLRATLTYANGSTKAYESKKFRIPPNAPITHVLTRMAAPDQQDIAAKVELFRFGKADFSAQSHEEQIADEKIPRKVHTKTFHVIVRNTCPTTFR